MFYLPTYEECNNIVKNNESFFKKTLKINNTDVTIFSYRLADYKDFKDNKAFELRGLTFIKENNEWKRFIALNKFFNVNQNEDWNFENLKDKNIEKINTKLDGSMIHFVKIGNKIYPKTKMDFKNDQTKGVMDFLNKNKNYQIFIKNMLVNYEYMPIFEYVSPKNQIVLEYPETKLYLIALRDMKTGEYIKELENFEEAKKMNIEFKKSISMDTINYLCEIFKIETDNDLEKLMKLKEIIKNIEGWVIHFYDGTIAKVKTDWYMELHGIISYEQLMENRIIKLILEEEIDDVLAQLSEKSEKRKFINNIIEKVNKYYNHSYNEIEKLIKKYKNLNNRKEFAIKYKSHPLFGVTMHAIKHKDIGKSLKSFILKETNLLEKSRKFLNNVDNKKNNIKIEQKNNLEIGF